MKTHAKNHQAGFTLLEFIVALVLVAFIAAMVYTYFGTALTQSSVPIARLQNVSNLQRVMENIVADYNRLNALNLRYHWQPNTYYGLGSIVTPKTIPATPDGGHYYRCTTAGTSGANEPSWPTTPIPTDGGVTWQESGNIVWQKAHSYTGGDIVVPINNNGHYYRCTATAISGSSEPSWKTDGTSVTDGGVTWTEAGTVLDSTYITDNLKNNLTTAFTTNPPRYGTGYTLVAADFIKFNGSPPIEEPAGTSDEKNILKVTIKNNDSAETLTAFFTIR